MESNPSSVKGRVPDHGPHKDVTQTPSKGANLSATFPEPPPPIDKFYKLRAQENARPRRILNDHVEWVKHLKKELGSDTAVDQYFDWLDLQNPQPPGVKDITMSSLSLLISHINWTQRSAELRTFNSVLRRTSGITRRKANPLAWTCEEFLLGLEVNGSPFTLPDVDSRTCSAYDVDSVNSGRVIGIRYTHVGDLKMRSLLCAPLGHIYFSARNSWNNPWFRTGLVLVVEILKDGKAGRYFIISNLEADLQEDDDGLWFPPGGYVGGSRVPPMLGGNPSFTVASIDGASSSVASSIVVGVDVGRIQFLTANGYNAKTSARPPKMDVKLKVESRSKPEIVRTGSLLAACGGESKPLPVPLYPLNKVEKECI